MTSRPVARVRAGRATLSFAAFHRQGESRDARRVQVPMEIARPFGFSMTARVVRPVQYADSTHLTDFTHPLLEVRERLAGHDDPQSTVFIAAGRKAARFVARTPRIPVARFPYGDTPRFPESRAIAAFARDLFPAS